MEKTLVHLKEERVVMFDCDDTLVKWHDNYSYKYIEPDTLAFNVEPEIELDPKWVYLKPHKKHIEELMEYSNKGYCIVVWSMGGSFWAREVVRVLQLEKYVDLVMAKPQFLFDDMPLNEALGLRIFLNDK